MNTTITTLGQRFTLMLVTAVLAGCMAASQHRENMERSHSVGLTQGIEAEIAQLESTILSDPDRASGERHIKLDTDIITLMEIGALYHYAGHFERSNEALEIVYAHYADEEMKTDINVTDSMKAVFKSTVTEGFSGPYDLAGYEKVYLHTLKALNYLMLGSADSAMVEIRRAEHQHAKIEDKLREDAEENAQERAENAEQFSSLDSGSEANSQNKFMEEAGLTPQEKALVAGMKDGYRNPMTYNLSSVVYELHRSIDGDAVLDDASLDLRKSLELYLNSGVADRYARWTTYRRRGNIPASRLMLKKVKSRYPAIVREAKRRPSAMRNVHVFLHTGDSPRIEALDIRIPNPISLTMSKMSIARYRPVIDQEYRLEVSSRGIQAHTGKHLDFDALALKHYEDKLNWIWGRAIIRLVVHTVIDRELNKRMGLMGSVLAAVKNEMLEQADTRSWISLPKAIHYGTMQAGGERTRVQVFNQAGQSLFSNEYPMESGKVLVVNIRKFGSTYLDQYAHLDGGPKGRLRSSRRGSSGGGSMVRKVQAWLTALGYDPGPADGAAGAKTKDAVRAFQSDQGKSASGSIDNSLAGAVKNAYRNMVREVQTLLSQQGYDVGTPDGVPGRKTRAAVKAYQQSVGLPANGAITLGLLTHMKSI